MAVHRYNRLYLGILAGIASMNAQAVGLGNISVRSTLNQPLRAEVPMIKMTAAEAELARVFIRSDGADASGSTNSSVVSGLAGKVVAQDDGRYTLQITSRDNIREPVLSFYVELVLPNAHARRDFTVLLDPPALAQAQAAPAMPLAASAVDFDAMERSIDELSAQPGAARDRSKRAPKSPQETPEPIVSDSQRVEARPGPRAEKKTGTFANGVYGPVMPNETLWAIAQRVRPGRDVSIQEMMDRLLAANPEAFINRDINRLKVGVTLRVTGDTSKPEQTAIARAETVASASSTAVSNKQESAPHAAAQAADEALASPAKSEVSSQQQDASAALASASAETAALNARLEELQNHLTEMQRLIDERNARIGALESELGALRGRIATLSSAAPATVAAESSVASAANPQAPEMPASQATAASTPATRDTATPDTALEVTALQAAAETKVEFDATAASSPTEPSASPAAAAPLPTVESTTKDATPKSGKSDESHAIQVAEPTMPAAPVLKPDGAAEESLATGWFAGVKRWIVGGLGLGALVGCAAVARSTGKRRRQAAAEQARQEAEARKQQFERRVAEVAEKAKQHVASSPSKPEAETVWEEETVPNWSIVDPDHPGEPVHLAHTPAEPSAENKVVPLKTDASRFDPLFKEVDLQLAYLQFEDAEALLQNALKEFPEHTTLQVKLADVLVAAGNIERFVDLAVKLSRIPGFRDSDEWKTIARLGETVAPTHPLFEYVATVELTRDEHGNLVSRA